MENNDYFLQEIRNLTASVAKLKETQDKFSEIIEKKKSTKDGKEESDNSGTKNITQNHPSIQALTDAIQSLTNAFLQSSVAKYEQFEPAERTNKIAEATARAGRPLSKQEIREIFKREVDTGREISETMQDAEAETSLMPKSVTRTNSLAMKGLLYVTREISDFIDRQVSEWIPGGRR